MMINTRESAYKLTQIQPSYPYEKKILVPLVNFNALLLLGTFLVIITLSINLMNLSWTLYDTIIYTACFSLVSFLFVLNKIGYFKASTILAQIGFSLLFCSVALISGDVFKCGMMNLLWMVVLFRYLETSREQYFLSGLQLLFVNVTIYLSMNIDYAHELTRYDPKETMIIYTLIFILLFIVIKRMFDQVKKSTEESRRLVKELELKNEKITLAYVEMEDFSHKVSHDLKAPIRTINSFATQLVKDIEIKKEDRIAEYSTFISASSSKLVKMIDDVLAYSKLNSKEKDRREQIQLKEIVTPLQKNLQQIYPNSKITLINDCHLTASRTKLTMLFQNLIENGLKYNKSEIKRVSVDFIRQPTQCTIYVKDNGIGIPSEYQEQIFNLFSRLHSNDDYEGTGIGLSTCKKIVEEHLNGNITVSSKPNEGSTFTIVIPH